MRDLAVHAANAGANDTAAIAADQSQITNALASINKISEETQFGGKKLLDGSAGIKTTVTGLAATAANFNYATTLATSDTVSVNMAAQSVAAQASITGTVDLTAAAPAADGSFQLTGNGTTVTINYLSGDTQTELMAAVNAYTDQTGIVATTNVGNNLILTSQEYGADAAISFSGGADATAIFGNTNGAAVGTNAEAVVTHSGGAAGNVSDALWASGNGTVLMDSLGNTIALTVAAATVADDKGAQATTASGSLIFQVGAFAGQTREINIAATTTSSLGIGAVTGLTLADIDVTTSAGAQNALDILDKAISDLSTMRANLGATQKNTLESSINSLTIAQENIQASESSIRDTDMAAEMVNFTKYQILQQAGVSMLSQANQSSQALLSLLR
jgi:flagellin